MFVIPTKNNVIYDAKPINMWILAVIKLFVLLTFQTI